MLSLWELALKSSVEVGGPCRGLWEGFVEELSVGRVCRVEGAISRDE